MSKVYLLSGASSGIGAKLFELITAKGNTVIPIARDKATAVKMNWNKYIICDFSNPEHVYEQIKDFQEPIDGFINCAGIAIGKPIWDTSVHELTSIMNINLISPMAIISSLKNNFKKNGQIILISSKSAYGGGWDDAYIASKGGINSLVKSLANKCAPDIRVIGIAPGVVADTRMTNERKLNDLDNVINRIPLHKLATTSDISNLILAMTEEAGAHITGAMIDINGGEYMR